jgi:hypothetical protein
MEVLPYEVSDTIEKVFSASPRFRSRLIIINFLYIGPRYDFHSATIRFLSFFVSLAIGISGSCRTAVPREEEFF